MRTPEETQRLHGERVEARQRERAFIDHHVSLDESPGELTARLGKPLTRIDLEAVLFANLLLDIIAPSPRPVRTFESGPPPVGALTYIGEEGDGLRAVPKGIGCYHGEFRQVVANGGIMWRVIHSHAGPIAYLSAEAALNAAKHAKKHSEDHS